MISIERVPWADERAVALRAAMDEDMDARYARPAGAPPEDPAVAAARDLALTVHPEDIVCSILAVVGGSGDAEGRAAGDPVGRAVGHIAVRRIAEGAPLAGEIELKRLIVLGAARGQGAATRLLDEAAVVAREQGAARMILQTGDKQPEAVALYEKTGWTRIPNYEPYASAMPFSICFAKPIA